MSFEIVLILRLSQVLAHCLNVPRMLQFTLPQQDLAETIPAHRQNFPSETVHNIFSGLITYHLNLISKKQPMNQLMISFS
ncbi:hypothetical protein BKA64DRAFT_671611 [Cadophora sp. MPI-SDFR-AT-0126]|nr:hypothetical protein BKA64DRAFT_671611 [Leotiomycetes sp. MPI-SDFR-AT-0126]